MDKPEIEKRVVTDESHMPGFFTFDPQAEELPPINAMRANRLYISTVQCGCGGIEGVIALGPMLPVAAGCFYAFTNVSK